MATLGEALSSLQSYCTMKSKTVSNRNRKPTNMLYDHVVWHTKYNRRLLEGQIRWRTAQIIRSVLDEIECKCVEINVQPNHVHLLFAFPPKISPSKVAEKIKSISSRRLRREFPILVEKCPKALWMPAVMHTSVGNEYKRVIHYIRNQDKVHSDGKAG